jgi:phospholipase C
MRYFAFGVRPLTIASTLLLALAACGGSSARNSLPSLAGTLRGQAGISPLVKSKIKHIIIIVQENRSFNNLFLNYPGATTQPWGLDSENNKITLKPVPLTRYWDMEHNGQGFIKSCNGTGKVVQGTGCRMNGFDKLKCGPLSACPKGKKGLDLAYSYAPPDETKPYFDMAHQYVLADQMYASDFDVSSFISHQYIIAGVNPNSSVDYPSNLLEWGCTAGPSDTSPVLLKDRIWLNKKNQTIETVRPCWDPNTIADELDAKKLSWAFYAVTVSGSGGYSCGGGGGNDPDGYGSKGIWSAYQAIKHICYGPDWDENVKPFSPPSKFLTDVKGGELRAVTWITPTCADSDHAGCNGGAPPSSGPSWVTSVVNAVGHSKFWDSSAIFIFWDDSGGWYDPEPPKYLKNSNYDSLGYRLPLLIISPYAKKGYVDHTHYEHGTILRFIENTFGLTALNKPEGAYVPSDVRANPPKDAFNFDQPPRKFVTIKAPLDAQYFIHERLDGLPPDTD